LPLQGKEKLYPWQEKLGIFMIFVGGHSVVQEE
jgi:hypothetical protein